MEKKIFEIKEFKIESVKEDGEEKFYISGYANTKNKADSYGDIPTNFNGKPVYDLKRMKTNPVLLVDHKNSAGNIAGVFTRLKEDDKGLSFKARLMNLEDAFNPIVKHAISAFKTGFGHALSIGGTWHFEDDKNKNHLTKAIIHEVSLVGIGADGNALTDMTTPKSKDSQASKIYKAQNADKIKLLEKKHGKNRVQEIETKIKELRG